MRLMAGLRFLRQEIVIDKAGHGAGRDRHISPFLYEHFIECPALLCGPISRNGCRSNRQRVLWRGRADYDDHAAPGPLPKHFGCTCLLLGQSQRVQRANGLARSSSSNQTGRAHEMKTRPRLGRSLAIRRSDGEFHTAPLSNRRPYRCCSHL